MLLRGTDVLYGWHAYCGTGMWYNGTDVLYGWCAYGGTRDYRARNTATTLSSPSSPPSLLWYRSLPSLFLSLSSSRAFSLSSSPPLPLLPLFFHLAPLLLLFRSLALLLCCSVQANNTHTICQTSMVYCAPTSFFVQVNSATCLNAHYAKSGYQLRYLPMYARTM
eukprot:139149-Rhodomonas_salina.2